MLKTFNMNSSNRVLWLERRPGVRRNGYEYDIAIEHWPGFDLRGQSRVDGAVEEYSVFSI